MLSAIDTADRLIVALDVQTVAAARVLVERLDGIVAFYKIGLELAYAPGGFNFAADLARSGAKLFLDLKLHDIPNTVERATRQVAWLGATFLTVHAYPQTMAAARRAADGSATKLLAVTVMTSYNDADVSATGASMGVSDLVSHRAGQARDCGIDGLILSPQEISSTRALVGSDMLLVTPGVRPLGVPTADQKRIMTPGEAIAAGADYLVVGRPVTEATDPRAAAVAIQGEIAAAANDRLRTHSL